MLKEFRDFAMKGNVVDLAVAVIIGAAFGAIVTSLVGDIIMPIIGLATRGLDFTNYFIPLTDKVTATNLADAKKQGAVLAYGNFLQLVREFCYRRLLAVHRDQRHEPSEAPRGSQARRAGEAVCGSRVAD